MFRRWIVYLLLAAATWAVHAPVLESDFVLFDDPQYVTENAPVLEGLTADGLTWAFTTGHASNWHPITWLSHMLDVDLFGVDPAGHHATNLLLHVLNALLLFGLLNSMTERLWPSALVAALFALHPLHVESVAWVAERKDVLCTFLGLLTVAAWLGFLRRGGGAWYVLTMLLYALGLMAKPMLVTLPLVLLLLDVWPLRRLADGMGAARDPLLTQRSPSRLLLEKLPLLLLAVASSAVTFLVQRSGGAVATTDLVSFPQRAANAVVSTSVYLRQTVWPDDLSIMYVHPDMPGGTPHTLGVVLGAGLLLLAVTVVVLRAGRRGAALVGWLGYLGTLVPVVGLVQVGQQAHADRYTYLPLVGIFVVVAWLSADLVESLARRRPAVRTVGVVIAVVVLGAFAVRSRSQVRIWRDNETLMKHALTVAPTSPLIHFTLGTALLREERYDEAAEHLSTALEISPQDVDTLANLGMVRIRQGRLAEALPLLRNAVANKPEDAGMQSSLAVALRAQGALDEAMSHARRATELEPDTGIYHYNLGNLLFDRMLLDEASDRYRRALELNADLSDAHRNWANILARQGSMDEAIEHYREAIRIAPEDGELRKNLRLLLEMAGRQP
jgi:Tfp pilus assembly protein PilF